MFISKTRANSCDVKFNANVSVRPSSSPSPRRSWSCSSHRSWHGQPHRVPLAVGALLDPVHQALDQEQPPPPRRLQPGQLEVQVRLLGLEVSHARATDGWTGTVLVGDAGDWRAWEGGGARVVRLGRHGALRLPEEKDMLAQVLATCVQDARDGDRRRAPC